MPQQSSNISLPESKIYARRHSRGHLRHLVPPEALGLAGHDKPVPHLKVNRKRVLRSPVLEPKPACCPERQAGHCRTPVHTITLTQYSRSRSRFGLAATMVESGYGRANDIDK